MIHMPLKEESLKIFSGLKRNKTKTWKKASDTYKVNISQVQPLSRSEGKLYRECLLNTMSITD